MRSDSMPRFEVRRLAGALGAEVHHVRLAEATVEDIDQIRTLLGEHLVLFFPSQSDLTPEAHVAVGRLFGEMEIHPFLPKFERHSELAVLDSAAGVKADVWHTDVTFSKNPPLASILQLVTCPDVGGDTMWSNQQLVYRSLSTPLRDLLDGLTAIHSFSHPRGGFVAEAEHPVVRTHPETGHRSLYVNRLFTSHIPQLSRAESDALLKYLFGFSEQPQFTCRYHWRPGDVAIWDNRATQHYAINDYTERRIGRRVTILGDEPAGDDPRWTHHVAPGTSAANQ
ncbi:TauD/TfdA dioxygenase family protein [Amycolatopsis sp. cg5]|uniref:TauD/TfdA dioxygenase family protein n=1 Tax=Amycolatopsis sp. cg5 TaxID=3238802 RepID=UPI003524D5D5